VELRSTLLTLDRLINEGSDPFGGNIGQLSSIEVIAAPLCSVNGK